MLQRLLILVLTTLIAACASGPSADPSTPEGAFKIAEEYEQADRWDEAVMKYGEVKNQFPYSRYAIIAELKMADLHFKREAYPEAQGAYQLFKELHPKHEKIDYVSFQIGMSYYKQLPPTNDRDLTLAKRSIVAFEEVIRSFPQSEYAAQAQEYRDKSERMLAEKELYIARFYFKEKKWEAALGRFENVLDQFPKHLEKEALYGACVAAARVGEPNKSRRYLSRLESMYKDSSEYSNAKSESNL